jgi:hypothetical protein
MQSHFASFSLINLMKNYGNRHVVKDIFTLIELYNRTVSTEQGYIKLNELMDYS